MSTTATLGNTPENRKKAQERFKALLARITADRAEKVRDRLAEMPASCRRGYLSSVLGRGGARRAVKAFCLECVGWDRDEVRHCTASACPLYAFRPFKT